jgi:hypothetical protein
VLQGSEDHRASTKVPTMNEKKSCLGCRALNDSDSCILGYKIRKIRKHNDDSKSTPIPVGKCPKPRTYAQLDDLLLSKSKK